MELPKALKPWAIYLNLFPAPINGRLGLLVHKLDRLLGPFEHIGGAEIGEPEGYDGIDRRGSYERLLMSEWLLAEELPDEFIRRATSGEHAFIQLARVKPASNRAVLAIFDSGPSQLGSPRIAHIALMVVLSRRAEAAGMRFEWGILQDSEAQVFGGVTKPNLQTFTKQRFLFEATNEQLEKWFSRIGNETAATWIIGGTYALRHKQAQATSRILIEPIGMNNPGDMSQNDSLIDADLALQSPDPAAIFKQERTPNKSANRPLSAAKFPREHYDDSVQQIEKLSISVHYPGRQTVTAMLSLPEQPQCVRLLRNLFGPNAALPVVTDRKIKSNICFSQTTRYLFGRTTDNTIVVHNVPTFAKPPGKAKLYTAGGNRTVFAASFGRNKRAAILVSFNPVSPGLTVEFIGGQMQYICEHFALPDDLISAFEAALGGSMQLQQCSVLQHRGQDKLFTLLADKLIALPLGTTNPTAEIIDGDILAFTAHSHRILYAQRAAIRTLADPGSSKDTAGLDAFGVAVHNWQPDADGHLNPGRAAKRIYAIRSFSWSTSESSEKLFLALSDQSHTSGLITHQNKNGEWTIYYRHKEYTLPDPGGLVIGGLAGPDISPTLMVLNEEENEIQLKRNGWEHSLPRVHGQISSVTLSANGDIAYLTDLGELSVYSHTTGSVIYCRKPGDA